MVEKQKTLNGEKSLRSIQRDSHHHMFRQGLPCIVDLETTGTDPSRHEIVQMVIIPLDWYFYPHNKIAPINYRIRAMKPEEIDEGATHLMGESFETHQLHAMDMMTAQENVIEWFNNLGLMDRRKLVPIAHNWPFDREFLIEFFGRATFNELFSPTYRDTMAIGGYLMDFSGVHGKPYAFADLKLGTMCRHYEVPLRMAHDALSDGLATAELYRCLLGTPRIALQVKTSEESPQNG
jgi:DNA polymerase III epsilon subunit-like protein